MTVCKNCGSIITSDNGICEKCGHGSDSAVRESETDNFDIGSTNDLLSKIHNASDNIFSSDDSGVKEKDDNIQSSDESDEKISQQNVKQSDFKEKSKSKFSGLFMMLYSKVPPKLKQSGNNTLRNIGMVSFAALALIYLVCFFGFMADICTPIAFGSISNMLISQFEGVLSETVQSTVGSANPLWMIVYFVLNLFPIYFAVNLFIKKKKSQAFIAVLVSLFITIFSLIAWGMCQAKDFYEAITIYDSKFGMMAWYALMDSLSEAWYLKVIFSGAAIFGISMDCIINGEN